MASGDVTLVGAHLSPFVVRVKIALYLKGVPYEFKVEDLPKKSELLLKSNPVYKKVPVLIHDGKPISESQVIVEYVEDVWGPNGPAVFPSDPVARADARFWGVYINDKLYQNMQEVLKAKTDQAVAEALPPFLASMKYLDEAFTKCSKGKSFFGGDTIGFVDIALGSLLGWMKGIEEITGAKLLDAAVIPNLAAWAERFVAHDAVKDAMPDTAKVVALGNILRSMWK